jgi:hypothetical protein
MGHRIPKVCPTERDFGSGRRACLHLRRPVSAGREYPKQAELRKIGSWQQGAYVEKAGWATMPGSSTPDTAVAKACAGLISNLKL